jgi:Transketolase, pyrimidine binding domain
MAETLSLGKALNHGLRRALENDSKVIIMGEDVGKLGGVFRITDGLQKDFGEDRVIDTPLAEATGRSARSSSTGSCSPRTTRSSARSRRCSSGRWATSGCRS